MTRVLLVCTANICRSPMAETVARALTQRAAPSTQARPGQAHSLIFDSAGTHAQRKGEPTDERARTALSNRGYVVGKKRSRPVIVEDFGRFDLILAMDQTNLTNLRELCPPEHAHKPQMFLDYAPGLAGHDVPDPYYGSAQGFERVLDICELGARGLIQALLKEST